MRIYYKIEYSNIDANINDYINNISLFDNNNINIINNIQLYYETYNKSFIKTENDPNILTFLYKKIYYNIKETFTDLILNMIIKDQRNIYNLYKYKIWLFKIYLLYNVYYDYCINIYKTIYDDQYTYNSKISFIDNFLTYQKKVTYREHFIKNPNERFNIFDNNVTILYNHLYKNLVSYGIIDSTILQDTSNIFGFSDIDINYILNTYINNIKPTSIEEHIKTIDTKREISILNFNLLYLIINIKVKSINNYNNIVKYGGSIGYKSTHKKVNIMNNEKVIERVIYIDNDKNKFIKLNKNYFQLSTFKYIIPLFGLLLCVTAQDNLYFLSKPHTLSI
jgi:hypothetical protein